MKGMLVIFLVLVVVIIGFDMIKMLWGWIFGVQFIRNFVVVFFGVVGGVVGLVVGGILFSLLGLFGVLIGCVVGGVLGGMIVFVVLGKIVGVLVEEDCVKILVMIQEQVIWFVGSFLLIGYEIENLNENLVCVIDQNVLEIIFVVGI